MGVVSGRGTSSRPSPRCIRVVEKPVSMGLSSGDRQIPGCRASEMLAAGTDDRLDELPVGVFVRALHQLRDVLPAVRGLIIRAVEIERTKRIVRRTNEVDGVEAEARHLERVAQRGGFR